MNRVPPCNTKLVQYSTRQHNIKTTISDKKFIVKLYINTMVSNSQNKIKPIRIPKEMGEGGIKFKFGFLTF
jgi:hypothetical protein